MSDDQIGAEVAIANAGTPAIVHPVTGEILELDSPTDILAAALNRAKEQGAGLQSFTRAIKNELLDRMDYEHVWTARVGNLKIEGDGERSPDYDGDVLMRELSALPGDLLSTEAILRAVEKKVVYVPKKRGINALLKATDERVLAAVKAAEIPNTKPRDVRVTPEP